MSYTYIQNAMALDEERGGKVDGDGTLNPVDCDRRTGIEARFDPSFASPLALREKQIQQSYRPIIGVHKWFARRPGTLFRSLLLAEFVEEPLHRTYWRGHCLQGVVADPFMGGGTPIFEANRLGFDVVGTDINPMAYWVVRQSLAPLNLGKFTLTAETVAIDVERELAAFYHTECLDCGQSAEVKYFLWVKIESCPNCGVDNDLFPGYLLAEAKRHPKHVVLCTTCGELNEYERQPTLEAPEQCCACGGSVCVDGPARRGRVRCRNCEHEYRFPRGEPSPPRHRMWAIEYHCSACRARHKGRFFKRPDANDLDRFYTACCRLGQDPDLPIPNDEIPAGDETDRLHRWGYQHYREMFNERQLFGLAVLLRRIREVSDKEIRHALLTVFSDFLRYQNMLCRYDTYALKCQDIFSVHGFPVGLIPCENNLLGIPRVGSGSFRHFIEKYKRAKRYCEAPFETRFLGRSKKVIVVPGERIEAELIDEFPQPDQRRQAYLLANTATEAQLPPASLDGVFTDPPYFDNVQYAELMDFCYVWLRLAIADEMPQFRRSTTRTPDELTGNATLGRGLEHFTAGLSTVFQHYAVALKPDAPFVFTYHHNDPMAYVPLVVAILDARLNCTATLPAVAEMSASLHIAGTNSSVLDSVFVCRVGAAASGNDDIDEALRQDAKALAFSGLRISGGDLRCLAAGHIARLTVNLLAPTWDRDAPLVDRMRHASECILLATNACETLSLVDNLLGELSETYQ